MNEGEQYRTSKKPWLILIACCIVDGLGFTLGTTGYSVFLTPIKNDLGLSMFEVQLYNTACMACTILSTFFGVKILKMGTGKVIAICSGLIIAGWTLMAFSPSVTSIFIAGCFGGISYPLLSIFTMPIIISNWFHTRQGTWISIVLAMSGFVGLGFSPAATALIASYGWQTAMSMVSMIMIVPLLLGVFVIRANPLDQGILPHGATMEDIKASKSEEHASIDQPGLTRAQAMKSPAFIFLVIALFCIGLQSGYAGNMNPMIQSAGYGAMVAGLGMSAMSLGNLVCKPIIGILRDRFGAIFSGICGYGAFICGMVMMFLGMTMQNDTFIIAAAFVTGLGGGAGLVMPSLYTKDAFGSKDFDRIYSVQMGIRSVGCAVAAPLAGVMYDMANGYDTSIILWITVSVCVISFGWAAVKVGRKAWGSPAKLFSRPDAEPEKKEPAKTTA